MSPSSLSRVSRRELGSLALGAALLLLVSSACEVADGKPIFVPLSFFFSTSTNSSTTSAFQQLAALSLQNKVDKLAVLLDKFALQGVTVTDVSTATNTTTNTG